MKNTAQQAQLLDRRPVAICIQCSRPLAHPTHRCSNAKIILPLCTLATNCGRRSERASQQPLEAAALTRRCITAVLCASGVYWAPSSVTTQRFTSHMLSL